MAQPQHKGGAEVILLCLPGLGVMSSLLSTGPGQRVTSLTYPTGTLLGPGRLPPAGTTEWGLGHRRGHDPCHGASAVPDSESTRALSVTAGADGGSRGRRLGVDAHDSSDARHVAAAVPWYLYGSDGHGAARVEDEADRARNVACRNLTVSA